MRPFFLHAIGHFHPENVIDNAFLESLDIGTNHQWIVDRVGIESRRTVLPLDYIRQTRNVDLRAGEEAALYDTAETGARAAKMALERAGLQPSDITMVVAGGCAPGMQIPADACRIASQLGIEAPCVDINSACSSFGAHAHLIGQMAQSPEFGGYVLSVQPENTTRVVNYTDRSSCVLWGDGTTAAIYSGQHASRILVEDTLLDSNPAGWKSVVIGNFGHFSQEGSLVQRFAIKTSLGCLEPMLARARAQIAQRGRGRVRFIGHQANLTMLESVARRAQITDDEHWHNIVNYGNTGAAGAPSVLSQHWDDLQSGDEIVLVVVGSGLSWASARFSVR
jgi:3-oxoacyl-[acyl-carrier-protein] synthase-3